MNAPGICFDARMAQASGIGTYIRGLLGELGKMQPPPYPFTVLAGESNGVPASWSKITVSSRFYSLGEQASVPWAFHRSGASLFHAPHYNLPVLIASRCVVTVHDAIHLKFPEFLPSRLASIYANAFFYQWVPRAQAILTVSEHTKKDLVDLLSIPESKITVTPPGVPDGFRLQAPSEVDSTLASLGLQRGYFLFVGNLKEFKNVPRLLEAYKHLKTKHPDAPPFIWVGRNFIPGFDRQLADTPDARWLSEIEQAALPAVYAGALALVFPSLYEGFGLPPLEAMACGTPVICSLRASLPEVVGEAALFIDPLSVEEMSNAMARLWQSPEFARQLSEKGLQRAARFSWSATAEKTLQVYHQCLEGG
jgi:glycosyltransferase involved in cell wall biosynthesis